MDLAERLVNKDRRAAARLITMAENGDPQAEEIIAALYDKTGNAHVIGITGPPGAGKSTLTDKLIKAVRKEDKTAAVIAIDPTSPFTGGAILGDRVRMNDLSTDPGVFVRSMATRGHLGGLSKATSTAVKILEIYGADYIFIETVGVGQSEIEIAKNADTTLMVMVPGLGDDIQALKAGVMEIGDVFAVNKADREGAQRTQLEIQMMLELGHPEHMPTIRQVVAVENKNIDQLLADIKDHRRFLEKTGALQKKRTENCKLELMNLLYEKLLERIMNSSQREERLQRLAEHVTGRQMDPYTAVQQLLADMNIK